MNPEMSDTAIKLVVGAWMLLMTAVVLGGYACPQCEDPVPCTTSGCRLCEEHLVQVNISQYMFEPMGNAWLEPVRNEPYQISLGDRTTAGITDAEGGFVVPLCPTEKYRLEVSGKTIWLYPHESNYRVMLK